MNIDAFTKSIKSNKKVDLKQAMALFSKEESDIKWILNLLIKTHNVTGELQGETFVITSDVDVFLYEFNRVLKKWFNLMINLANQSRLQKEQQRLAEMNNKKPQELEKQKRFKAKQREIDERARLERLKKLLRVSRRLKIEQIGDFIGLKGEELFQRLVEWAAVFGFKIDRDEVDFENGRTDDFIAELEKSFATWGDKGKI